VIYPVWDGRSAVDSTAKGIVGDVKKFGWRNPRT
jgi:hypothetical protein